WAKARAIWPAPMKPMVWVSMRRWTEERIDAKGYNAADDAHQANPICQSQLFLRKRLKHDRFFRFGLGNQAQLRQPPQQPLASQTQQFGRFRLVAARSFEGPV